MCRPNVDYMLFVSKGRAKGWSDGRIERAWAAYQNQMAREDARVLNAAPPPPPPIVAGDTVRWRGGASFFQAARVLATHVTWAWIEDANDRGVVVPLSELERATA